MREQGPDGTGVFVGQGYGRLVPGFRLLQRFGPAAARVGAPGRVAQFAACAVDEQRAQLNVAAFVDAPEPRFPAGGVLSRRESDPGGELAIVAEIVAVSDRGDDDRGGDRSDAAQDGDASCALVVADEGLDLAVEGEDALMQAPQFGVEFVEQRPRRFGHCVGMGLPDRKPSTLESTHALRCNDAELREAPANTVGRPGVFGDAGLAQSVYEQDGLLLGRLDRHEAHRGPPGGLADRGCVVAVVLAGAALGAIGGDEARIDDALVMPEDSQLARPVMGAEAGFHATSAGGRLAKNSSRCARVRVLGTAAWPPARLRRGSRTTASRDRYRNG